MGRGPTNENTNMYFQARKKAATYNERLWSREGAAELLGISVSTLADYELGNTKVVPVDKVVLMADLYNAPELITGYCMRECPVHGFLPLATEEKSLEGIALRLLQNFNEDSLKNMRDINRQIEVIKNLLGGMSYRPLDMWEHLKEVLDDPHALVIANPPTYFSGYEKFYDTQGKMTWKEPPYELFDPETGHQQFYDLCMDAKALVICYQEKRVGEAVGYTIYARSGTRADLNAYITTNREEEATALANGKKIKRPAESKLQPLDCSMLPRDYVIQEDSKVQVIPIKSAEAQYYRELWTHNFVGSSATFNRALLIDGYVAGVFGISKMAADSVFVWYVMKVPHRTYRLGRLCYMLAQNREFVDTLLDNIEQEKVTKMRTAMLTRYPENKEVRGIMKLVNRVEDKKNGYKLTYEAELVEGRTEQQTLQEWLRRENEWQKNRAKASSKSKDAK